jgi:selenocysteine lyase/cysteine desulfurase
MISAAGTTLSTELEQYFSQYRKNIIGIDQHFESPFGTKKIVYTDWTASGRLYRPIEEKLINEFGPFVANTHTETTVSGTAMTNAYHEARHIIKHHVNAGPDDVLITDGSGMTGVVNKFQRILGLKVPENLKAHTNVPDEKRPVVFVSHMEHHSNQTSWLETIAHVEVIPDRDIKGSCKTSQKRTDGLTRKSTDSLITERSDSHDRTVRLRAPAQVIGHRLVSHLGVSSGGHGRQGTASPVLCINRQ